jgi:hypothetical protein
MEVIKDGTKTATQEQQDREGGGAVRYVVGTLPRHLKPAARRQSLEARHLGLKLGLK